MTKRRYGLASRIIKIKKKKCFKLGNYDSERIIQIKNKVIVLRSIWEVFHVLTMDQRIRERPRLQNTGHRRDISNIYVEYPFFIP